MAEGWYERLWWREAQNLLPCLACYGVGWRLARAAPLLATVCLLPRLTLGRCLGLASAISAIPRRYSLGAAEMREGCPGPCPTTLRVERDGPSPCLTLGQSRPRLHVGRLDRARFCARARPLLRRDARLRRPDERALVDVVEQQTQSAPRVHQPGEMVRGGPRWSDMVRGGPRWSEKRRDSPRFAEVVRGGPRCRAARTAMNPPGSLHPSGCRPHRPTFPDAPPPSLPASQVGVDEDIMSDPFFFLWPPDPARDSRRSVPVHSVSCEETLFTPTRHATRGGAGCSTCTPSRSTRPCLPSGASTQRAPSGRSGSGVRRPRWASTTCGGP